MRNVFVYYDQDKYKIIDKATDKLFYEIDDVVLFNSVYRRYKGIKGWHGILSEEVNINLVEELNCRFWELKFIDKIYFPRYSHNHLGINIDDPVKKAGVVKLKPNHKIYIRYINDFYSLHSIKEFTKEWSNPQPIDEPHMWTITTGNLFNVQQRINQLNVTITE